MGPGPSNDPEVRHRALKAPPRSGWVQFTPPLPRAALSQGCWQKKARPANVLVIIRFAQEEALTSGQGFYILLMLPILSPSQSPSSFPTGLFMSHGASLQERRMKPGAGKAPKGVGTKCQAGNSPAPSPAPWAPRQTP